MTPLMNFVFAVTALAGSTPAEFSESRAEILLANGFYQQAAYQYQLLADNALESERALRFAAISQILKDHPNGKYELKAIYPSGAGLLFIDPATEYLEPGEVELKHPLAMKAALRDLAVNKIKNARKLLDDAEVLIPEQHEYAERKLSHARRLLRLANLYNKGIADSYRMPLASLQIDIHRKRTDILARDFDTMLNRLNHIEPGSKQYYSIVAMLLEQIDDMSDELNSIVEITSRFPDDFKDMLAMTFKDIQMLQKVRKALLAGMQKSYA